ncbi:MAG: DUF4350 domain-containing protein [Candidatus Thorarchaeota archaeon]
MSRTQGVMLCILMVGLVFLPIFSTANPPEIQINHETEQSVIPTQIIDHEVRIAFYDEANTTVPEYGVSAMNAEYTEIKSILSNSDYEVSYLDANDIANYELITAHYDVVILADNIPREYIVNQVKDFWLGGGGVLALDSAAAFLVYAGILPRENESIDDGYQKWWRYMFTQNSTVVMRHPISVDYSNGSNISHQYADWGAFDWTALAETSVFSSMSKIAVCSESPYYVNALTIDAPDKGGKAVYLGIPVANFPTDWESMLLESLNWLTPRPKARIAFDYSHQPHLGVDVWDDFAVYLSPDASFSSLRDSFVSRRYTFDKFIPSPDANITLERLSKYDILILCYPALSFDVSERQYLFNWVEEGGGLFILGDRTDIGLGDDNLNYLLERLDMTLGSYNELDIQTAELSLPVQPTVEGCSSLEISFRNYIQISGENPHSIWEYSGHSVVASQEYGVGRVVLFSDMNILENSRFNNQDNSRFAVNVVNWLSSDDAAVLLYTDDPYDINAYRSQVSRALNELGIHFHLTFTDVGFNAALNGTWFNQQWGLAILDHCNYFRTAMYDELAEYIQLGGHSIANTFRINALPEHQIWPLMGAYFSENWDPDAPAYVWQSDHPIFNEPANYSAVTLNVSEDAHFGDDGDTVSVFNNATALAGATSYAEDGKACIVLRNDGKTLLNSFLLNNFRGDVDNSGYIDAFELWLNQIAFMTKPYVNSPADISFEYGSIGEEISWQVSSFFPTRYTIEVNGVELIDEVWEGDPITILLDGYLPGIYVFDIRVYDNTEAWISDSVTVTVLEITSTSGTSILPTTSVIPTGTISPTNPSFDFLGIGIGVGLAGVVIIILLVYIRHTKFISKYDQYSFG